MKMPDNQKLSKKEKLRQARLKAQNWAAKKEEQRVVGVKSSSTTSFSSTAAVAPIKTKKSKRKRSHVDSEEEVEDSSKQPRYSSIYEDETGPTGTPIRREQKKTKVDKTPAHVKEMKSSKSTSKKSTKKSSKKKSHKYEKMDLDSEASGSENVYDSDDSMDSALQTTAKPKETLEPVQEKKPSKKEKLRLAREKARKSMGRESLSKPSTTTATPSIPKSTKKSKTPKYESPDISVKDDDMMDIKEEEEQTPIISPSGSTNIDGVSPPIALFANLTPIANAAAAAKASNNQEVETPATADAVVHPQRNSFVHDSLTKVKNGVQYLAESLSSPDPPEPSVKPSTLFSPPPNDTVANQRRQEDQSSSSSDHVVAMPPSASNTTRPLFTKISSNCSFDEDNSIVQPPRTSVFNQVLADMKLHEEKQKKQQQQQQQQQINTQLMSEPQNTVNPVSPCHNNNEMSSFYSSVEEFQQAQSSHNSANAEEEDEEEKASALYMKKLLMKILGLILLFSVGAGGVYFYGPPNTAMFMQVYENIENWSMSFSSSFSDTITTEEAVEKVEKKRIVAPSCFKSTIDMGKSSEDNDEEGLEVPPALLAIGIQACIPPNHGGELPACPEGGICFGGYLQTCFPGDVLEPSPNHNSCVITEKGKEFLGVTLKQKLIEMTVELNCGCSGFLSFGSSNGSAANGECVNKSHTMSTTISAAEESSEFPTPTFFRMEAVAEALGVPSQSITSLMKYFSEYDFQMVNSSISKIPSKAAISLTPRFLYYELQLPTSCYLRLLVTDICHYLTSILFSFLSAIISISLNSFLYCLLTYPIQTTAVLVIWIIAYSLYLRRQNLKYLREKTLESRSLVHEKLKSRTGKMGEKHLRDELAQDFFPSDLKLRKMYAHNVWRRVIVEIKNDSRIQRTFESGMEWWEWVDKGSSSSENLVASAMETEQVAQQEE